MRQRRCAVILASWLMIGLSHSVLRTTAYACAVCAGGQDQGYFWGVLFLMSMPFAVGSFVGGWLVYHYRRARGSRVTAMPSATVEPQRPRPASRSSASERQHDGAQAHPA
jgi:hypothetical protein